MQRIDVHISHQKMNQNNYVKEKKNTNESRKHSNSLKSTGITINSVR